MADGHAAQNGCTAQRCLQHYQHWQQGGLQSRKENVRNEEQREKKNKLQCFNHNCFSLTQDWVCDLLCCITGHLFVHSGHLHFLTVRISEGTEVGAYPKPTAVVLQANLKEMEVNTAFAENVPLLPMPFVEITRSSWGFFCFVSRDIKLYGVFAYLLKNIIQVE